MLASLLLVATTIAGYARLAVFDSDGFADRAAAALQEPSVRTEVGERVTDELVLSTEPDLIAGRPLIVSAVSGVVSGGAFAGLFRRAVRDAHRAVFAHDQDTVTLTLVDVGTVAGAALEKLRPDLAAKLEATNRIDLLSRRIGSVTGDLARTAERVRLLAVVLALLTLAAAGAALFLTADRRRVASRLGAGMAAAGVLVLIGYAVARTLTLATVSDPDARAAAGGVWDAFLGDLRTTGWVLAGAGAIVAAAAESLIRPVAIEAPLRALGRIATTEPVGVPLRLARASALVVIGLLLIAHPQLALQVVADGGRGLHPLQGHRGAAPARLPAARRGARRRRGGAAPRPPPLPARRGRRHRRAARSRPPSPPSSPAAASRRRRSRSRAATATPRCATAHSTRSCSPRRTTRCRCRCRAGSQPSRTARSAASSRTASTASCSTPTTATGSPTAASAPTSGAPRTCGARAEQDGVSPASVEAALRLRGRLGFRGEGTRGMYLCHTFCELGATPLEDGLKDIHDFLATHPAEVVVMVNQDYVKPADFVKAIDDADLTPYAFTPPTGSQWPTLREMIEDGRRLVMLAENRAGAAPWYQLAYERLTEETPFDFGSAEALIGAAGLEAGCRPNRGPARAPLFLINHWVTTAPIQRPSDAAKVNAYAPLLRRARTCERIRDHLPTLLAINFYKEGDVFRVVDTLNKVEG